MNANFKPLGLAAAVAAVTAGYAGITTAQEPSINGLGNVGLVPYYTVRDGFGTGVHITNTSEATQVVKVRLRRGTDSMDALDFNLILSPKDVWTGFLSTDGDNIVFTTQDESCTAPGRVNGQFTMPPIYRENAEEGYIEIIGMGQPVSESTPIAVAAKHTSEGVPADCAGVRSNFFANGDAGGPSQGVIDYDETYQISTVTGVPSGVTIYEAPENALKVSFFIRDSESGIEFGNEAFHLQNFLAEPSMTNQQTGLFSGDLEGFDYPDLNGGWVGVDRGKFNALRTAFGSASVINDWSANADLNVGTDWVITFPGQYTMLSLPHYFGSLFNEAVTCSRGDPATAGGGNDDLETAACDFRDIPATATFDVYDREEQQITQEEGGLVVSPQPPGQVTRTELPYEVNVVRWGVDPVLNSQNSDISVDVPDSPFGWAELAVTSMDANLAVCDATALSAGLTLGDTNTVTEDSVAAAAAAQDCTDLSTVNLIPKIGFVAWERGFPANPDANYGRIVEHSYGVAS
ncbi:hypothetical protein [Kineobactrum salinum]|uniref:Cell surface protein n=1 Tax=Kineobactrum salinum TaxID=2708301 RepID=A0A6C0U3A3_9GAMM|nr:hypothetical protein [Kineobactrum salinum]QIB66323.1 hypothetical protein G3T16_13815 [Kineobactrum salinum]